RRRDARLSARSRMEAPMRFSRGRALPALFWLAFGAASLLAQALPRARPQDVGLAPDLLGRIDGVFRGYVDRGQLPGAVVLVARHGRIAYLQAFGFRDRETKSPMRDDAIFRIASQSKAPVSG